MKPFVSNNPISNNRQGIVYKKIKGSFSVHTGDGEIACSLSARLLDPQKRANNGRSRRKERRAAKSDSELAALDQITVGDHVFFTDAQDGTGVITDLLPRRSQLSRRAAASNPMAYAPEQVIVANVDQIVPVFAAADPPPKWNMLDRYLVSAESADLPSLICITKLDLVQDEHGNIDEDILEVVEEYRKIGYPVVLVSAKLGEGLDELKAALQGRTSVFLGKSGVGKTSLLNALEPGLGLRVNEVSHKTTKGKHTTTHLEMFPLEIGGAVVDTPGVREFGLWDVEEDDLALFFPEMRPYVGRCKFGLGCTHDEEPGCAIRSAVLAGEISPYRYQSYLRLRLDP